jgi:hypothetical protein
VDIKSLERSAVNIIPKLFLRYCLSNAEDGTQDDILWNNSDQIFEDASPLENASATE